jgi:hypothetical protein
VVKKKKGRLKRFSGGFGEKPKNHNVANTIPELRFQKD